MGGKTLCSSFSYSFLLFAAFVVSVHLGSCEGKKVKADSKAVKYLKCLVCEEAAKHIYRQVSELQSSQSTTKTAKKLSEEAIGNLVESICDPNTDEGEWIAHLDLVQDGDKLAFKVFEDVGDCQRDCQTIALACREGIGEADVDLAEELWKGKTSRSKLTNLACRELTDSCAGKIPSLPKEGWWIKERFSPVSEEDRHMAKVMAQMEAIGGQGGASIFGPDDVEDLMGEMDMPEFDEAKEARRRQEKEIEDAYDNYEGYTEEDFARFEQLMKEQEQLQSSSKSEQKVEDSTSTSGSDSIVGKGVEALKAVYDTVTSPFIVEAERRDQDEF